MPLILAAGTPLGVSRRGDLTPRCACRVSSPKASRQAGISVFWLHSMNGCCWSPPICTSARWVKPASAYSFAASRTASTSSPHGMLPATSSSRTNWLAASNAGGPGSSALTFQPRPNQRNRVCARVTAASLSVPKLIGIWPMRGLPAPPAASNNSPSSAFGSTAIIRSASSPAISQDCLPDTATPIGTRVSGRSQSFADSTSKWSPRKLV